MEHKIWRRINILFLVTYSILLVSIMYITGHVANVGGQPYIQKILHSMNIIPFFHLGSGKQILCSFIIYIPLALLLPNVHDMFTKRNRVYSSSFVYISFVEFLQVITLKGYFDINDILFGMIGISVVYETMKKVKHGIENMSG